MVSSLSFRASSHCGDDDRTRLADPTFLKSDYDLMLIPTKEYARLVRSNISDVRVFGLDL